MPGLPRIAAYPMPVPGDLPVNAAGWVIDPHRTVLLIHDMQEYFLAPLPSPLRDDVVQRAAFLRERCTTLGIPVAYTAQPGDMTAAQRGLLMDFWGPGMTGDPADRRIVDRLAPAPDDWVFTKWRYSAFHRSDLLPRLRAVGRDQLLICGVYAHVGILMTAVEAFTNDIQPFVIADAVADFSAEHHRLALSYAALRCAAVVFTKEVLP